MHSRATREQNAVYGKIRVTKSLTKEGNQISKGFGLVFIEGNDHRMCTLAQPGLKVPEKLAN